MCLDETQDKKKYCLNAAIEDDRTRTRSLWRTSFIRTEIQCATITPRPQLVGVKEDIRWVVNRIEKPRIISIKRKRNSPSNIYNLQYFRHDKIRQIAHSSVRLFEPKDFFLILHPGRIKKPYLPVLRKPGCPSMFPRSKKTRVTVVGIQPISVIYFRCRCARSEFTEHLQQL
jgi:hypothetical protein